MNAQDLKVGSVFTRDGVRVTVLRDAEPAPNKWSLDWFRLWCEREDTGEQGYCTFGPGGTVQKANNVYANVPS
jgi:hypothetical protein